MKKICLVARQNIYKDSTHLHDDNGLRALNGIKYGKVHEIEDNEDPLNIWHLLRLEFKKENPTFHADRYFIRFEDGHEIECSDRMTMHTPNLADENFKKLAALFPNAVTETVNENGEVVRAIDKDVLMQEINTRVVDGREERYQFTWPDKKKAMLAANAPISATLRPIKADSVGKDGTPGGWDSENLYIEGDNLDVLKLLQEAYLGKVKMIYIDPPYNTGNDFVYEDDFAEDTDSYMGRSGQYDEQGNQLVANTDANGRFHTDWINMMYSRLSIAKMLLVENGAIFVSIDEHEHSNLLSLMNEIFGEKNYIDSIVWEKKTGAKGVPPRNMMVNVHEYIVAYQKSSDFRFLGERRSEEEDGFKNPDNDPRGPWRVSNIKSTTKPMEEAFTIVDPNTGKKYTNTWAFSRESLEKMIAEGRILWKDTLPKQKEFMYEMTHMNKAIKSSWGVFDAQRTTVFLKQLIPEVHFDNPKPISLMKHLVSVVAEKDDIVMDLFSGSATTAQAVIQINADDGGHRRFVMVQVPEEIKSATIANNAGYKNICEIGKERIRRAAKKIREDAGLTLTQNFDGGFRCLRLDSSNMQDVYYTPDATRQDLLSFTTDNIKPDRTPEDLLFQVMLELGVLPSSTIAETEIGGKKVFDVADGFLLACFDKGVTTETVTAIAKKQPYYAVFRDASMADDSTATNFDQIFETYSPSTARKVL